MRIAALWFPDWPIQAARMDADFKGPAIVEKSNAVLACDAAARRVGIRRGMRVRQAQAICPEVSIVGSQPDREGALFAELTAGLDAVASSVEVIRPGLVIVDAAAAGRFHGGEDAAVEMLVDAVSRRGLDATVGVAGEIATALIAARDGQLGAVIPEGGSREFLEPQPIGVLAAEVALDCAGELVEQLRRLGLKTLGDLARLPLRQVSSRFGEAGRRCHAIASAAPDRRVAPEPARAELAVKTVLEEPIERVDAAAFAARELAARLHARLREGGWACLRLRVVAELANEQVLERVWRTRSALSEEATADRVRWQLDGWLTSARAQGKDGAGIVSLILEPIEVAHPDGEGLWGSGSSEEDAKRVISRVQAQLGIDRVLQPWDSGGRGVAERVEFIPYGEKRDPAPEGSWPGRIPAPLPARLAGAHPAARIRLIDASAADIYVTAETLLSSTPHALGWGQHRYAVIGWAGPWPVDIGWWKGQEQRLARLQVLGQGQGEQRQRAWLLLWRGGKWRVEASYA
ncbi:DNA polymerase Y family protein [Corynebacterium flavescens]|uniref:DNA polymerase n=1 Tax=Corynebacterium flavescens TaxID=28028 RepID=A0A1L7CJZ8_CORFL|nr:DNA polymerase Y family protein [Corynebacterium flavescens]APT86194.1 DNA polymerase [Corynebacterium flavescens]KAA8724461.1 DNA polymerase Y family protein [Corynebacterium flavescens]MDN6431990.1 DNA polymerase Y family protein [Corynebacterium flavescens]MDN6602061.1 DNA polymerase Y family protein [Corynebacterium flavescens]MDN6646788.1 DNA polymerase Y family protein [Corynebacterium flavescens]